MSAPLSGCHRVLVLLPSWVGDVTMATPLLRALRTTLPGARLATLSKPGLSTILAGAPWIDERFESRLRGWAGPWTGLAGARNFGADAVLLLPNSLRSGLAGLRLARRRLGYSTQLRGWALTHALVAPSRRDPVPAVDFYARLGEWAIGHDIADRRPELFVTDEEDRAAARLLEGLDRFMLVNPGANRRDKRWPIERFADASSAIARAHQLDVAVTGSPAEREITRDLTQRLDDAGLTISRRGSQAPDEESSQARPGVPRVIDLADRGVALGSLKAVIRRASLLLTNDTGPRHLAAALGTPSIVLFGPTDHRWTTLPAHRGSADRLLLAEPFLPEPLKADDFDDVCRIDRISVGDVVAAAREALDRRVDPRPIQA